MSNKTVNGQKHSWAHTSRLEIKSWHVRFVVVSKQLFVGTDHSFFRTGQKTQQDNAQQYLQGIFCAERGKRNIERIVEEVLGSEYEPLQHFISDSPWDSKGLMMELAKNVFKKLQGLVKLDARWMKKLIEKRDKISGRFRG